MVVELIFDAGSGFTLADPGPTAAGRFMMYHNGRSHILNVSVSTEEARRRLRYRCGGGLFTKARRVDISGFLI